MLRPLDFRAHRSSMDSIAVQTDFKVLPKKQRSRVTNGRSHFVTADARGPWARRFRDLVELHVADLGGEGLLSEAQKSLIRRAATIETELEKLEGQLALGDPVNIDAYGRSAGQLRRILETLSLKRTARDVTPTLAEIAARINAEKVEVAG
jgi:hypothetical protein